MEYERALKEFYVLDDSQDKASEDALERSLSLSQRCGLCEGDVGRKCVFLSVVRPWATGTQHPTQPIH